MGSGRRKEEHIDLFIIKEQINDKEIIYIFNAIPTPVLSGSGSKGS